MNTLKEEFYASSESMQLIAKELCPRYIYCSHLDMFYKRQPYLNSKGFLTRFVGLGTLPGPYKPEGSTQTYLQAIDIQPQSLSELQE